MTDDTRAMVARLLAASPTAMSRTDALAHIHERRATLLAKAASQLKAEPDFTAPVPLAVVDDPVKFGQDYWTSRAAPLSEPPKPKHRPGRPPRTKSPKPELSRFTVIDGEGGDNKP